MKMTMEVKGIRNLQKVNRWLKPFKALHKYKGFDFESPITIISGTGNFTLNSLKKQISDINGKSFAMVLHRERRYSGNNGATESYHDVYYVDIAENFKDFMPTGGYGDLGSFTSKKDFNEWRTNKRENYIITWYLICQDKEYLKFKAEKAYNPDLRVSNINQSNMISYHGYVSSTKLDKSGYDTQHIHMMYSQRVKKLIAERKQERANAVSDNHITYAEKLKADTLALKAEFHKLIDNDEYGKIKEIFKSWKGYNHLVCDITTHINRLNQKAYSNVESIQKAEKDLSDMYNNIVNIINGNDF